MAHATLDTDRLDHFIHTVVEDLGAALSAALVRIGDKLGLYRALAGAGAVTPQWLAEATGTHERYVREWLAAQAAGGYVDYEPATARYSLAPEQAVALADEQSPFFMLGGFEVASACMANEPAIAEAFKSGDGIGWHEHDERLFEGTERFFRPSYRAHLVDAWLPALDGVHDKLRAGARAADVGCGHGASTILMAQAYPGSSFIGFDYHDGSIAAARRAAADASLRDRVRFQRAGALDYPIPDGGYDLLCFFDCLHDMGDPVGACRHALEALAEDGTVMMVEPRAGDRVEDNLNPVGRVFYSASTLLCTPNAVDQGSGQALGAQAGERRLREVAAEAGFTRFRRAAETPFNLVLEARP